MTAQEALAWFKEELKDGKCSDNCRQCNAYEVAVEALEKQIAKKPIAQGKYSFVCPVCKQDLGIEREDISVYDMTPPRHCECGQALDWSDME